MTGDAGAVRRTRGVPQGRVSSSGTITHGRPGQDAILTVTFVALLLLPGVPAVQFRIIVATGIFGVRPALRPQRTQRPRSSSSSRRAATIWCTRGAREPGCCGERANGHPVGARRRQRPATLPPRPVLGVIIYAVLNGHRERVGQIPQPADNPPDNAPAATGPAARDRR
jgi:hypothetical protein